MARVATIGSTPPEKLTVDQWIEGQLPNIEVFGNGVKIEYVTAYDCTEGWVEFYEMQGKASGSTKRVNFKEVTARYQ